MNDRITPKERGLIKGALRRVFSRSELRQRVLDRARIEHYDPNRPRVKKWSRCEGCQKPTPTYLIDIDHIEPLVPLDKALVEMSIQELLDRQFCEESNLQNLCQDPCHLTKSVNEGKVRRANKKAKKRNSNVKSKGTKRPATSDRKRTTTRDTNTRTKKYTTKRSRKTCKRNRR